MDVTYSYLMRSVAKRQKCVNSPLTPPKKEIQTLSDFLHKRKTYRISVMTRHNRPQFLWNLWKLPTNLHKEHYAECHTVKRPAPRRQQLWEAKEKTESNETDKIRCFIVSQKVTEILLSKGPYTHSCNSHQDTMT